MNGYRIGIDLGGTAIKSAIFDANMQPVLERCDPTEAAMGPQHVLHKITRIVQQMLAELSISESSVACMGMGIPGLLDPESGLSFFSPNFPEWENIHVVNEMKQAFAFPIFIDNDVRVNLYGEWLFGAGLDSKNILMVTLGTGLGSGIVVDGAMLYGKTASAGEIGHMNMYREGRPCRCGSSGCLGRYVSAIGMVRTFTERLEHGAESVILAWTGNDHSRITAQMISEAYDTGDALAIEVMHETGVLLGFGLSNAINLLNPELVIIGGGMSAAGDRLLTSVRETVKSHSLQVSSQACRIVPAALGGEAGMVGAAAYGSRRLHSSGPSPFR
ncbi:ROK family protein [Gorillibacterium timonense]|uniref:ROK family protein n=1 Tax=Gorillibacterium timonense TaxID=1689269 RepID=UPI00071D4C8D|nr:ROK family protein [Gorillibacterium timonense]